MKKENSVKAHTIDSIHKKVVPGNIYGYPLERIIYRDTGYSLKKKSLDKLYMEFVSNGKNKKGK